MQWLQELIPNSIEEITDAEFFTNRRDQSVHEMTGVTFAKNYGTKKDPDVHYFKFGYRNGRSHHNRLTGADKYSHKYFDVYLSSVLYRMFPQGHDNIQLMIAHPPNALPYRDTLIETVGGLHAIKLRNGNVIRHNIPSVTTFDECSGGMICAHNRPIGNGTMAQYNPYQLSPKDDFVIFDFGGKVSSATVGTFIDHKTVAPDLDNSHVFELGIQDVFKEADFQLKHARPDVFTKDVDPRIMRKFIEGRGTFRMSGKEYVLEEAYERSTAKILNSIDAINKEEKGFPTAEVWFVSGGAGALFVEELKEIAQRPVFMVDDYSNMVNANCRGGSMIFDMVMNDRPEIKNKAYNRKSKPVFLTVDLGNEQAKAVAIYG